MIADSAVIQPPKTLIGRLLRRPARPAYNAPVAWLRVGKKSQITYVLGNANKVSQASAGKIKAPALLATDSSTLNAVTGGGDLAAANGAGSTVAQQHTQPAAPGIGATLAAKLTGPLGWVAAAGAAYGLWWLIGWLPRRRTKEPQQPLQPDNGLPS